jgi:hypothetical protein
MTDTPGASSAHRIAYITISKADLPPWTAPKSVDRRTL